ncbi:PTS sugar transporter subunit IIA [Lactobacillus sp. ESL0681]|uniref:PTS sugar transporter subunit IIA n=1 Tax=Lactobacillus sp. ESL0681 TaxID=2983211 RepID=UPI0023F7F062|nr:PTS sugar transporter subunit IIA [Lactobacillus sp. ESL0681]WEV40298.1 PTS sugar transporter subunit IIA [Lactobacillus sp. ESL0681]
MEVEIFVKDADKSVNSYQDAIQFAGNLMLQSANIDAKYIDACIDREVDFPTGLLLQNGSGVAMPHGDAKLVRHDSVSLVRIPQGVEFGKMEDKDQKVKCSLVFNLALTSGEKHITVLRKLVSSFQNPSFIDYCSYEKAAEVKKYVSETLLAEKE